MKLVTAKYACWFCRKQITLAQYARQTPVWVRQPDGEQRLLHADCAKPARVAARLNK